LRLPRLLVRDDTREDVEGSANQLDAWGYTVDRACAPACAVLIA